MAVDFIHLHNHFLGSFSDSVLNIDDTIKKLKRFKQKGIAITDHADLSYIVPFITACEKKGIKPIIGTEAYFVEDAVYNIENNINMRYHLVLFAKNYEGLLNLIALNNESYNKNLLHNRTALVDWKLLEKYNKGLICSSACFFGIVPQYYLKHGIDKAKETAEKFKNIWNEDYYFELGRHFISDEDKANEGLIELSKMLNIKCIVTNDVHFLNLKNWIDRDVIIKTRFNKVTDFSTDTKEYYLKSTEQMSKLGFDEEYLKNTMEIYEKSEITSADIDKLFNSVDTGTARQKIIKDYLLENNYYIKEINNKYEITKTGLKEVYKFLKSKNIKYINMNYKRYIRDENFERFEKDLIKVNPNILERGFDNILKHIQYIPRSIKPDFKKICLFNNDIILPYRKSYFVKYLQFMDLENELLNKLNIVEFIINNTQDKIETFCRLSGLDSNSISGITEDLKEKYYTEYICADLIHNTKIIITDEIKNRINKQLFLKLMNYSFEDYINYNEAIKFLNNREFDNCSKFLHLIENPAVSKDYYFVAGKVNYYIKDYNTSIDSFKKYLAENYLNFKTRSTVLSFIGWAYNWLDNKDKAYDYFIKSLKSNQYNELALYGKGIIEFLANDFCKSEKTFNHFLIICPTSKRASKVNKLLKIITEEQ